MKKYVLNHSCLDVFWNSSIRTCSATQYLELAELVSRPHSHGQIHSHSDRLHYFPVTISRSRCYKNVHATASFLTQLNWSKLWNSLPVECLLSLSCDLIGFKLTDTFFLWIFSKQLSYILFIF